MTSFYKRFNLELPDQEEVQLAFIKKAKATIYNVSYLHSFDERLRDKLVNHYCHYYGQEINTPSDSLNDELLQEAKSHFNDDYIFLEENKPYGCIEYCFFGLLRKLEFIYNVLQEDSLKTSFSELIKKILSLSEADLEITWRDGEFYPSGAKVLDKGLVNDVLDWLDEDRYANVKTPFAKALSHYLEATKKPELLADVITDMYEALEAFAKVITGRKGKDLSANADLLINKLKLSDIYKKMLKDYISYANEYRHGLDDSKRKTIPKEQEVEAVIYQTGLFLRLGIKSLK